MKRLIPLYLAALLSLAATTHAQGVYAKALQAAKKAAGTASSGLGQVELMEGVTQFFTTGLDAAGRDFAPKTKLPGDLTKFQKALEKAGQKDALKQLNDSVTQIADASVPRAVAILKGMLNEIKGEDIVTLLAGKNTSLTDAFREATTERLNAQLKPFAEQIVPAAKLDKRLSQIVSALGDAGKDIDQKEIVEKLVELAQKQTVNGIYGALSSSEVKVRADPDATKNKAIIKAFTSIKK
ncbi:DUF4197 family protein [Opitutaceae bacterium TAV4]|uniref:DUF4197 family protein n=1 Tax=Geminisphaera colitermitum TaxID=1148786 RepID=UPI000158D842|nr:DUF4197 family protein [Geminisphaera colitermitum]RRJ95883.1 DUF4197 family protein [Opitutaceae bacterium TAV4]RRK00032.1 DUF4197 family protein [Opitutaceae bacterium TAV3]